VSWWPFDGSGADIKDGNPGAVLGGQFVLAEVGSGFNSSNGMVTVPSAANLNVSQFTIETWLRADNIAPPNMIIVWKGETGGGFNLTAPYFIEVSGLPDVTPQGKVFGTAAPGKVSVLLTDGVHDQIYYSKSALSVDGTFHHVAATVDGGTVLIYIDGKLDAGYAQMVTPFTTGSNPFQIGGIQNLSTNHFQGVIDELSLYNRALAPTEIQAIFNAGSAGKCKGCQVNVTSVKMFDAHTLEVDAAGQFSSNPLSQKTISVATTIGGVPLSSIFPLPSGSTGTQSESLFIDLGANSVPRFNDNAKFSVTASMSEGGNCLHGHGPRRHCSPARRAYSWHFQWKWR
jgi:hypothetical protein